MLDEPQTISDLPAPDAPVRTIGRAAFYAVALLVVVLDQVVKALVRARIPDNGTIPLWPGVFHLTHTRNPGMAFSLLEGATPLLVTAALFVMAVIVWVQWRHGKVMPALLGIAFALPLGGAAGNLIDRVLFGKVTDLFDFVLIHFPVFNVADAAITVGVGLLAYRTSTQKEEDPAPSAHPTALAASQE